MVDAQRQLLDSLMGVNRDGDRPDAEITDFRDKRVCKNFLCGLCPHDLFASATRIDLGDCPKLHSDELKALYDEERKTRDFHYEVEWERMLNQYVQECDRRIQRALKRLEEQDGAPAPMINVENNAKVLEITAEIQDTLKRAEQAGEDGEVDLSMELSAKVEELTAKKAEVQAQALLSGAATVAQPPQQHQPIDKKSGAAVNQKLRVCDVCGAYLSIFDSDHRLAEHFGGKMHLGYLKIRQCLTELRERKEKEREERRKQQEERDAKREAERGEVREGDRGGDRGPRDHYGGRRRSRSRSRSRDRFRDQRYHRNDRYRRRSGSRDRRRRSGSRDRSPPRGGDKRREFRENGGRRSRSR